MMGFRTRRSETELNRQLWERLGGEPEPSWYLDPITAGQKRETHLRMIREFSKGMRAERILKTDLFEEAFGEDSLLDSLFPEAVLVCGMDAAFAASKIALRRHRGKIRAFTCDVRNLAVQDCSLDIIVSTSTLDHFDNRADFLQALAELARVLKPDGLLIITLDNPWNPLYHPLRWLSRGKNAPFPLGYTVSTPQLERDLSAAGLHPKKRDWLLHNPRGISTLLFLALRKVLPTRAADTCIRSLLDACEQLGKLPTRKLTACFAAVAATKR